jgi:hypothetical protein
MMFVLLLLALAAACPPNCQDCLNGSPYCFACASGFQLSFQATCVGSEVVPQCALYVNDTYCSYCQPSFGLRNNSCVKDYSGCTNSDPNTGECFVCQFGTLLNNGTCRGALQCQTAAEQCPQCRLGWTLSSGKCQDSTGNCAQLSQQGVCLTCKANFKLVGYECVPSLTTAVDCYIYDA